MHLCLCMSLSVSLCLCLSVCLSLVRGTKCIKETIEESKALFRPVGKSYAITVLSLSELGRAHPSGIVLRLRTFPVHPSTRSHPVRMLLLLMSLSCGALYPLKEQSRSRLQFYPFSAMSIFFKSIRIGYCISYAIWDAGPCR